MRKFDSSSDVSLSTHKRCGFIRFALLVEIPTLAKSYNVCSLVLFEVDAYLVYRKNAMSSLSFTGQHSEQLPLGASLTEYGFIPEHN